VEKGGAPPVLKELSFNFDRSGVIFTRGLPACHAHTWPDSEISQACLVGRGAVEIEAELSSQPNFEATAPLEIFNIRAPGGRRALLYRVHAHLPALTTFSTVGAIEKARGRFGTRIIIPIPKIVDGLGRVSGFHARIGRSWAYKGRRVSLLRTRCPRGTLEAEASMEFTKGALTTGTIVKPCS
jgi:hypothetical protein